MEGKNMFDKKNFIKIVIAVCTIFSALIGALTGKLDKPAAPPRVLRWSATRISCSPMQLQRLRA